MDTDQEHGGISEEDLKELLLKDNPSLATILVMANIGSIDKLKDLLKCCEPESSCEDSEYIDKVINDIYELLILRKGT